MQKSEKNIELSSFAIGGTYVCNPSKSEMQRALLLAALAQGETIISPVDRSNDSLAMLENIQKLGAEVQLSESTIKVTGTGGELRGEIELNCGESGFGLRSLAPVLACSGGEYTLTGEGTLLKRPVDLLHDLFAKLDGIDFESREGFLPIRLSGKVKAVKIFLDGSKSSQHISGLLMGLPLLDADSEITLLNLKSEPYLNMTLNMMRLFGVDVTKNQNTYFIPNSKYQATNISVQGDWSGAAFLLAGAFLHGNELRIKNLRTDAVQADKSIVQVLEYCGAKFKELPDEVYLLTSQQPKSFSFDATHAPDLFPPLAVLASGIDGESTIKGLHRLKHKESDRKSSIESLLRNFGVPYQIDADNLIIKGGKIHTPTQPVATFNDHRIAMAACILASFCDGKTTVENISCIDKSYPDFLNHLKQLRV